MAILSQFTRPARFDNRRKPRYFWPPHQKFWRKILPEATKSKGDGNSGANRAIIWGGVVSAASHHITFAFSRRKCFDWEIQLVMGGGLLFHSRALVFFVHEQRWHCLKGKWNVKLPTELLFLCLRASSSLVSRVTAMRLEEAPSWERYKRPSPSC